MSDYCRLLTAPELDAMTPDQRAAAVGERIVTNLDELPAEFRQRVVDTGARLGAERRESERPAARVRVTASFFDRLDELLPPERSVDGTPSATDFLLHDLPAIIDLLAEDFERRTVPIADDPEIRALVAAGVLVAFVAVLRR